ncbi:MAG TPA: pitrilysin family protein [Thermoanaerobaculia bacterium]|nr:pitrilysin family protein [Thermoanaerobaculia bacterium]
MSRLDRSRPPQGGSARAVRFPPIERHRFANGLEALVVVARHAPLAMVQVLTPAGTLEEPLEKAGLATLTASLLDEGTAHRTGPEIAAAVEQLGGELGTGANWDLANAWLQMRSRDLGLGLELLTEIVTAPELPEHETERLKQERLAELLRRKDSPETLAEVTILEAVYGRGGPYGRSILGDESTVARIGREDVAAFFRRYWGLAGGHVLVVGDVDPGEVFRRLEGGLGATPAATSPAPTVFREAPPSTRRVVIVDRPHARQTELRLGKAGLPRNHPQYLVLRLLSSLLGGKFTSRLNLNLRERLGLTYSVQCSFQPRRGPSPWVVRAAVATDATAQATAEALAEIERLRTEPVGARELAETVDYLTGTFAYTLQTLFDLAGRLEELVAFGLPDDAFERQAEQYRAITAGQIRQLAEEMLDPAQMPIVAVGPAAELEGALAPFGEVSRISAA